MAYGRYSNRLNSFKPKEPIEIFWFEPEQKWAISTPFVSRDKMKLYLFWLKNDCQAIYDSESKTWLVPEEKLEKAKEYVLKWIGPFNFRPKLEMPQLAPLSQDPWPAFMQLTGLSSRDLEAAKAAYRKAAFTLHPDRGGDPDQMSKLNTLWAEIKKERQAHV